MDIFEKGLIGAGIFMVIAFGYFLTAGSEIAQADPVTVTTTSSP